MLHILGVCRDYLQVLLLRVDLSLYMSQQLPRMPLRRGVSNPKS